MRKNHGKGSFLHTKVERRCLLGRLAGLLMILTFVEALDAGQTLERLGRTLLQAHS